MVDALAADAQGILQSLLDLYGTADPQPAAGAATLDAAGTAADHSGALATRYGTQSDIQRAFTDAQTARDTVVRQATASAADITTAGRTQIAQVLAEFGNRLSAVGTVGDTRFSGPAVLEAAGDTLATVHRQVAADTSAAQGQAAHITPPAAAGPVTGRNTNTRKRAPRPRRRPVLPSDGTAGSRAVQAAGSWLGTPYVWGGGGTGGPSSGGFDCSGLTQYAIAQASGGQVVLPRTTYDQIHSGVRIAPQDARAGDLVFPASSFSARGPEHVQLAAGNGMVIEAPHSGAAVQWSRMPSNAVVIRVL